MTKAPVPSPFFLPDLLVPLYQVPVHPGDHVPHRIGAQQEFPVAVQQVKGRDASPARSGCSATLNYFII